MLNPGAGIMMSRFLRPAADAADADEAAAGATAARGAPIATLAPTTGAAAIRFIPNELGIPGATTLLAIEFACAVAEVTTGDEMTGTCETAKSAPLRPVTSVVDLVVRTP